MTRKYEGCFLLRADLPEEELEKEVNFIEKTILETGAEIVKKELWGRKNLTYPIKKKNEAVYYLFYLTAPSDALTRITANYRVRENILRYMFIQRKKLPGPEGEKQDGQSVA